MMASEYTDISPSVNTMPLANQPIWPQSSISESSIIQFSWEWCTCRAEGDGVEVGSSAADVERVRLLHELTDAATAGLRREEPQAGERGLHGAGEQLVVALEHLERLLLHAPRGVDHELRLHLAAHARRAQHLGVLRLAGAGRGDHRLLHLELEVRLIRHDRARPARDALGGAAGH